MRTKIIKEGLKRAIPSARVLVEKMLKKKKKKISKKEKEKIIKEVQDAKNFKNEEIRRPSNPANPYADDFNYEPGAMDIEKKIFKKYGISFKKGGRLNDGNTFVKSLYKDKL